MTSVKRRGAAACQNSSAHSGRIKTSPTRGAFLADVPPHLVTTKIFPYENVGIQDLAGIRVNNVCRISGPVNLNLLRRLAVDMHGGAALLFVLLDVIAEL